MARRALSLIEVVVALGLVAVILPLLLSLFPTSLASLRQSERLQVATTLAAYRLDEACLLLPNPGVDLDETVTVGKQRYRVVREYYALDPMRLEAVVTVTLDDNRPDRLATRLGKLRP